MLKKCLRTNVRRLGMAHKIGEVFGVDYRKFIERGGLGRYRPSPNKKGFLSEAFQSIAGGGLEPPTSGL